MHQGIELSFLLVLNQVLASKVGAMKKTLILLLIICGIALSSSIQASNINGAGKNKNTQSVTEIIDISDSNDLNTSIAPPSSVLIILVIVGFFFAKKHQNLAKKHQDLVKRH